MTNDIQLWCENHAQGVWRLALRECEGCGDGTRLCDACWREHNDDHARCSEEAAPLQKAAARFLADTASSDEHRWLRDIVEAVCRIEPETLRRLSGGATPQLVGIVVGICLERLRSGYYDSPLYCFTNGEGDVIEDDGDPPRTTWQTAQEAELARQAWTSTWGGRECGYVYRLATP